MSPNACGKRADIKTVASSSVPQKIQRNHKGDEMESEEGLHKRTQVLEVEENLVTENALTVTSQHLQVTRSLKPREASHNPQNGAKTTSRAKKEWHNFQRRLLSFPEQVAHAQSR